MRNLFLLLSLTILLSCEHDVEEQPKFDQQHVSLPENLNVSTEERDKILKLGFSDITGATSEFIIVEGDIMISRSGLLNKQVIINNRNNAIDIDRFPLQVFIEPSDNDLAPKYNGLVENGINVWSDIDNFAELELTFLRNDADIIVNYDDLDNGLGNRPLARAAFPDNGNAGELILLDIERLELSNFTDEDRINIVAHELGHTLGLFHDDSPDELSMRLHDTPDVQSSSIMVRAGRQPVDEPLNDISWYDQRAIRMLYPESPVSTVRNLSLTPTYNTNGFTQREFRVTYETGSWNPGYEIEVNVTGTANAGYAVSYTDIFLTNNFGNRPDILMYAPPGSYTVTTRLLNYKRDFASNPINGTVVLF